MSLFKIELKPIKLLGYDKIPDEKKKFFDVSLNALVEFMKFVEGVKSASIDKDHSIIVECDSSLEDKLSNLSDKAIITKLS